MHAAVRKPRRRHYAPAARRRSGPPVSQPGTAVPFGQLAGADLVVDRAYAGRHAGTAADDPIGRLVTVGNQGGFRYRGSPWQGTVRIAVLYTTATEPDWPDTLDQHTGLLTYYGDNHTPGRKRHAGRPAGHYRGREHDFGAPKG